MIQIVTDSRPEGPLDHSSRDSLIPPNDSFISSNLEILPYKTDLKEMTEKRLLLKALLFFLIPSLLFGLFSFLWPLVYSIVPAHESNDCICLIKN